jgi:dolichol-phosphate mannosyltransferase
MRHRWPRLSVRARGPVLLTALRVTAAAVAVARLARAARRPPPLALGPAAPPPAAGRISVVIPARDEAARIGPLLAALGTDPGVAEVIVVDDESTDGTAPLATAAGATVVRGRPLPPGWVGKVWALQQGLDAATGDWVVTFDADAEPQPGTAAAVVQAALDGGHDVVSVGPTFRCPTAPLRLLHPALLTTLVYRFGPPHAARRSKPGRLVANGQCTAFRRQALVAAGGYAPIAGHLTDDVALVRHLAALGWRPGFLDGHGVLTVSMHSGAPDAWREWGRSLPMPDVTPPLAQAADLAVVWAAQALPLPRLLTGRGDALDVVLLALRLGTLAGTASAYRPRGWAYWCSPLADVAAALRLTDGALRPARRWRGRTYDPAALRRGASAPAH